MDRLVAVVKSRDLSIGRVVAELRLGSERGFVGLCLAPTVSDNVMSPLFPGGSGRPGRGCCLARLKGKLLG